MKVIQWNTHHGGTGSDGKLNVAAITDFLVRAAPDVVSLNELEQNDSYGHTDQLEQHRAALQTSQGVPWFATFCQLNGGSKNLGIGVGVLSKTAPLTVVRKDLGGRPGLVVYTPGLFVATTHADPDSAAKRNAELAQLLILLSQGNGTPRQIICGDYNAVPTSVEMAPWPVLYQDAWTQAGKINQATSFNTTGVTHGVHRIDYIWYKGLTIQACDVPDTRHAAGIFPSDHHPVVATFA
jgi:endonuclease/exonuclease/phosphatase family metal-dependent hydrolase